MNTNRKEGIKQTITATNRISKTVAPHSSISCRSTVSLPHLPFPTFPSRPTAHLIPLPLLQEQHQRRPNEQPSGQEHEHHIRLALPALAHHALRKLEQIVALETAAPLLAVDHFAPAVEHLVVDEFFRVLLGSVVGVAACAVEFDDYGL